MGLAKWLACSILVHLVTFLVTSWLVYEPPHGPSRATIIAIVIPKAPYSRPVDPARGLGSHKSRPDPAPRQEYQEQLRADDESPLLAKELLFANYFKRIRDYMEHGWVSKVRALVHTGTRRVTVVQIRLSDEGLIVGKAIVAESGRPELDQAALEAIVIGALFPHPPKGLNGIIYWRFEIN